MDVRCGVRTARLLGVQRTVLYEGSDVLTVNGFVLPRDRGLEYASLKYRRRNSVIIIASLREYKRAPASMPYALCPMPLPTLANNKRNSYFDLLKKTGLLILVGGSTSHYHYNSSSTVLAYFEYYFRSSIFS